MGASAVRSGGHDSVYGTMTILPWRWLDWLASSAAAVCASG
jgi:hypothetical protein